MKKIAHKILKFRNNKIEEDDFVWMVLIWKEQTKINK